MLLKHIPLFLLLCAPAVSHAEAELTTTMKITGAVTIAPNGDYGVPVLVTVLNRGNSIAGRFKMGLAYGRAPYHPDKITTVALFQSPDRSFAMEGYYPWTTRALYPNRSISFRALILVPKSMPHGLGVNVLAEADVCWGEEFPSEQCRVRETFPGDNFATGRVTIP